MAIPNIKDIFELVKKGATIEAQQMIMELKENIISLQEENLKLKEEKIALRQQLELSQSGERCPRCKKGNWNLIESAPNAIFGKMGVLNRTYKCSICDYTETHQFNSFKDKM